MSVMTRLTCASVSTKVPHLPSKNSMTASRLYKFPSRSAAIGACKGIPVRAQQLHFVFLQNLVAVHCRLLEHDLGANPQAPSAHRYEGRSSFLRFHTVEVLTAPPLVERSVSAVAKSQDWPRSTSERVMYLGGQRAVIKLSSSIRTEFPQLY